MNERIKELVKQAGGHFSTHTLTSYPAQRRESIELWDDRIEKFAELIVRECYEHCKGQMLDKEVADTNELTYNDAVMDCSNGLLQHFGVEE